MADEAPKEKKNKRKHDRVKAQRVLVRVPALDRLRGQFLRDLSEGGAFIKSKRVLPVGAAVKLELFPLGSGAPLELRGTVVRAAADEAAQKEGTVGMAVEFEKAGPDVEKQVTELLAQCRLPKERGPEVDELVVRLQARMFDVAVLQDEVAERDRQLAEKARPGSAQGPGGAEAAALKQQVTDLTQELSSARERIASLQRELKDREDDEAGSRALAERLVHEKTALEKRVVDEIDRGKGERERVQKELARLSEKDEELAALTEAKAAVEAKLEDLEARLERAEFTAKAATQQSESQKEKLQGQLAQANEKLSTLEETLANSETARVRLATEKANFVDTVAEERANRLEAEALAKKNEHRLTELEAQLKAAKEARAEAEHGLDAMVDQQRAAAGQLEALKARVERLERDLAEQAEQTERAKQREKEVRRLLNLMTVKANEGPGAKPDNGPLENPTPTAPIPARREATNEAALNVPDHSPTSPPPRGEWEDIATAPALAMQIPGASGEMAAPAGDKSPVPLEFSDFSRRLRSGARLLRGARFNQDPTTDPVELAVANHLESNDSIDAIVKASKGRYSRERLAQVLFALYKRSVVELSPS